MAFGLTGRAEAVRGLASVLQGSGALGGAINVLTPRARFEPGMECSAGVSATTAPVAEGRRSVAGRPPTPGCERRGKGPLDLAPVEQRSQPGQRMFRVDLLVQPAVEQFGRLRL